MAIDLNKCTALEHVTLEQSSSHLWHDSRKVRIAASTAKKVLKDHKCYSMFDLNSRPD